MNIRIYVRASTKKQDATRSLSDLVSFSQNYGDKYDTYIENYSGTKLNRPELTKLLDEAQQGDILLVESVDRLSRLRAARYFPSIHGNSYEKVKDDFDDVFNRFWYIGKTEQKDEKYIPYKKNFGVSRIRCSELNLNDKVRLAA